MRCDRNVAKQDLRTVTSLIQNHDHWPRELEPLMEVSCCCFVNGLQKGLLKMGSFIIIVVIFDY